MKLALSLYSCAPDRGSEPGVGWSWAIGMSQRHETMVITRSGNREAIEAALSKISPIPTIRFLWVDPPKLICYLKSKKCFPNCLFYAWWQWLANRKYSKSNFQADVIHHVTFCSFSLPGFWWHRREKVALGPLGGFSYIHPRFFRLLPMSGWVPEFFRLCLRLNPLISPFFAISRQNADLIIFTEERYRKKFGGKALSASILDVAVPPNLESPLYDPLPVRANQFIWAGTLERWKCCTIAILAYHRAFANAKLPPILKIYGKGSEEPKLRRLVDRLGLQDKILFEGSIAPVSLWHEMQRSKGFVFSSVRDTCGSVNVEAMACGTPIVCFDHQGVGQLTDSSCAFRISPRNPFNSVIEQFGHSMAILALDDDLVLRMGTAARRRALSMFTWERKFAQIDSLYSHLMGIK